MQAFNPYLPSYEYVPDGEPYVFGDRLYVYGSHDRFNGDNFCLNDYVCYSAPLDDLGNWRYEGVIWHRNDDPRNTDGKLFMNAPDVALGRDGRYYLYYQLSANTYTSVAVCDTPAGQYKFLGDVKYDNGKAVGTAKGDVFMFDPGIFCDDDGKNYLYTGFGPVGIMAFMLGSLRGNKCDGGYCFELADDMMTVIGEPKMVCPAKKPAAGTPYEGHEFFEASSMRKIGDTYYFVYSSLLSHELCYATSKYPDRDFQYGGTLVSIGDVGINGVTDPNKALNYLGNTHGGMVEVNGQWYIFYHRQTNQQKCCRQGCAEKIYIAEDGSIAQAEVTSCGLNDGPLAGIGTYEARIACNLSSKEGVFPYVKVRHQDKKGIHPYFTQTGEDRNDNPDQYIANMCDGAWCGFKYFALDNPKSISVNVKGVANGEFVVSTAAHGAPIATIKISPCSEYTDFSAECAPVAGTKALYFEYVGAGSFDFREFTLA